MKTRWPLPRATMPSASTRASTIGARRLTASARSISSTLNEVSRPDPGSPALETSTSTPGAVARQPLAPPRASARSTASERAPVSAASGSRTSARRPVITSSAPAARRRRAMAWPRPPVAPVSRTVRPARFTRGKTATVAVKPCRKGSPPTGPISPAAKKPAAGAPASSSSRVSASWSGVPNIASPRPLQVKTSAPAGIAAAQRLAPQARAPGAGRGRPRRRRARAGARPCRPAPARRRVSVPASGSAPMTPRTRKSPCSYSGLPPSMTTPSSSPLATSACSWGSRPSIASRSASERRAPGELADDVPLGRGDGQLGPDRRGALRDARHASRRPRRPGRPRRRRAARRRGRGRRRRRACARWRCRPGRGRPERGATSSPSTRSVGNE